MEEAFKHLLAAGDGELPGAHRADPQGAVEGVGVAPGDVGRFEARGLERARRGFGEEIPPDNADEVLLPPAGALEADEERVKVFGEVDAPALHEVVDPLARAERHGLFQGVGKGFVPEPALADILEADVYHGVRSAGHVLDDRGELRAKGFGLLAWLGPVDPEQGCEESSKADDEQGEHDLRASLLRCLQRRDFRALFDATHTGRGLGVVLDGHAGQFVATVVVGVVAVPFDLVECDAV